MAAPKLQIPKTTKAENHFCPQEMLTLHPQQPALPVLHTASRPGQPPPTSAPTASQPSTAQEHPVPLLGTQHRCSLPPAPASAARNAHGSKREKGLLLIPAECSWQSTGQPPNPPVLCSQLARQPQRPSAKRKRSGAHAQTPAALSHPPCRTSQQSSNPRTQPAKHFGEEHYKHSKRKVLAFLPSDFPA